MVMSLLLYFAERDHFNRLQDILRPNYKWEDYCLDLQYNKDLWMIVQTAFKDAIQRMDFKDIWREEM